MPLRRLARSFALTLVTLGVTASTLATSPVHAVGAFDRDSDSRSGAVAMSENQVTRYDKTAAARRERAAQRFESRLQSAKQTALAQRGDAYSYGAVGPNVFDCSGLIFYSYRRAGFAVPRTSGAQAAFTRRVAKHDMRPGDLMFFHAGGAVYHAAIFLGFQNGRAMMVHSPGSGRRVTVAAPWTSSWFGGTLR
jgi:cell wall-associated NlpC family hydrolase